MDSVSGLKEQLTQKWQFTHDLVIPMQTESQVKFCGPQIISGASQQNTIAAFSKTAEVE